MPSLTTITTFLKLTPLILLILAANPSNAFGCFRGGTVVSPGDAAYAIRTACNALAGTYKSGSTNTSCQDLDYSKWYHIDFKITLKSVPAGYGDSWFISAADCIAQNTETAAGCGGCGGIREWQEEWGPSLPVWLLEFDPNPMGCKEAWNDPQ